MFSRFGGYSGRTFDKTGFFHTRQEDGRSWIVDPDGHPFFIVGIDHIDDSTLKYDETIAIYRERYGTRDKWISECVVAALEEWGFNTISWTQEWVTPKFRHSPEWTPEEFRTCGMPYMPHIDFLPIQIWNEHGFYMDVFSPEFEEWCDYQARYWCVSLADDPNLVGYAYTARPLWDAARFAQNMPFRHSAGASRAAEGEFLRKVIGKYYKTTHDSIRRYDPNHLIFGDFIDGSDSIGYSPSAPPIYALTEMREYVDIMCITWYGAFDVIWDSVMAWHKLSGKPVFLSDSAYVAPNDLLTPEFEVFAGGWEKLRVPNERARGEMYIDFITKAARSGPVIGWAWCSFMQNKMRRYGLKDRFDAPYECTEVMAEFNRELYRHLGWAGDPAAA